MQFVFSARRQPRPTHGQQCVLPLTGPVIPVNQLRRSGWHGTRVPVYGYGTNTIPRSRNSSHPSTPHPPAETSSPTRAPFPASDPPIRQPAVKMVKTATVTDSNARFANEHHEGLVCVFAGATGGIGRATVERMSTMLHSSTFYILGRNPSRYADRLEQWRSTGNKIVFIETQVSLISGIDVACEQIKAAEKRVDYLCMSTGGMPFQGAVCTSFGLSFIQPPTCLANR